MMRPHGDCLNWDPLLIIANSFSDIVYSLSYFLIPILFAVVLSKVRGIPLARFFWYLVGALFFASLTHAMEVVTLYKPMYWLEAAVDFLGALAAAWSAVVIFQEAPKAIIWVSQAREAVRILNEDLAEALTPDKNPDE